MLVEIRHFIPGRVRLYVPDLFRAEQNPEQIVQRLATNGAIESIRANAQCRSVVIVFHKDVPGQITDIVRKLRHKPIEHLLEAGFEEEETTTALEVKGGENGHTPIWNRPLVLPTVSLALAFSVSPAFIAINVPLMLWNSRPIGKRAWRVLSRERRLNVDFLDVLAIGVSMLQNAFVTAGIVVWLIRLGDWIRDLTAARSKRAVGELLEFQKKMAWVLRNDVVVAVPVSSLVLGDTVVVHSGEMIPVDGVVLSGQASVDQKTITGESLPVSRAEGDVVYAATAVGEGYIT